MTNKDSLDEDAGLDSSIFDILENDFQIGDLVWAKLNGSSWWPAFVYGCFSDNWKHVKLISEPGLITQKQYFVYCFGLHFKYAWVHETCLCSYKSSDSSENQNEQTITTIRNKFKEQISDELQLLWQEAVDEADKILALPIDLRINALEKIVRQLLTGTKYKIPSQEQITASESVVMNTSVDEDQQVQSNGKTQTLSSLCNITKRTVINKRFQVSSGMIEKPKRINATRREINEIDQSSRNPDSDVVIVKINTPIQSSSVSLTTAICHFLDKGIPSLTVYEEVCLVNDLLNHQLGTSLTLTDAQLFYEQYVINISSINYNHRMLFVQSDYFYDFLLKYPQIILKHRQWFRDFKQTLMPMNSDKIHLKKWQLATLLHAHMNLEQQYH